jgi:deoxyribodipyrimidine photo-lyase
LPIYILDDCAPKLFKIGSSTKIWLYHSLDKLNESLKGNLNLYTGKSHEIIEVLINRYAVKNIFWNICYEPWHLEQEDRIKDICNKTSTNWKSFIVIIFGIRKI